MRLFLMRAGLLIAGLLLIGTWEATAQGMCPFCPGGQLSLAEEIATMDAAVVVKLIKVYPLEGDELAKAQFEITDVIRGEKRVRVGDKLDAVFFGDGKRGSSFLLMGVGDEQLNWSSNPMLVTKRARSYLMSLGKVPARGTERLKFFQQYLEDEDSLLAEDAYHEFANWSYAQLKEFKPHLKHDQLVLFEHWARRAASRAACTAGKRPMFHRATRSSTLISSRSPKVSCERPGFANSSAK